MRVMQTVHFGCANATICSSTQIEPKNFSGSDVFMADVQAGYTQIRTRPSVPDGQLHHRRGFSFLVTSASHGIAPGVACQARPFSLT